MWPCDDGAAVVDEDGVIATAMGGLLCDLPYSHAAEWAGRWGAVCLARHCGIPASSWTWAVADNIAASLARGGRRPSGSFWVDRLRIAYIQWRGHHTLHLHHF